MKSISLLLIILCVSLHVQSQTLTSLDSSNGFKEYKFGTSRSLVKLLNEEKDSDGFCLVYSGASGMSAFGCTVSKIGLAFDQSNQLYSIRILLLGAWDEKSISQIKQVICKSFGPITKSIYGKGGYSGVHKWIGNKVLLSLGTTSLPQIEDKMWYSVELMFSDIAKVKANSKAKKEVSDKILSKRSLDY